MAIRCESLRKKRWGLKGKEAGFSIVRVFGG